MTKFFSIVSAVILALTGTTASAGDMFGAGYKPCGDLASTAATVDCVVAKTKMWDQRLNKAYSALMSFVGPPQVASLKSAERMWIRYRDANCEFYGSEQGTIREIKRAECFRAMTEDRALELEQAMQP